MLGADPCQCNSTIRQKLPIQQNFRKFGANAEILMSFKFFNILGLVHLVYFMTWSAIINHLVVAAP